MAAYSLNCVWIGEGVRRQFPSAKPSESHVVCQALSEDKKGEQGRERRESEGVCASFPALPTYMCVCTQCKGESAKDEWGGIAAGVSMAMMLVS